MDFIIILGIGAILVATGVISPEPKDNDISKEVKVVTPTNFILPETFFAAFNASKPELIWIVK